MVPRENKSNAYAKFWRDKQIIMVFLKVAYCIKICIIKLFRDCTCFSFGKVLLIKKQNFGVVSMILYFVYIVSTAK